MMAAAGVDLWCIQLFGRWGSDAFLLYIRSSPLRNMHQLAGATIAGLQLDSVRQELAELRVAEVALTMGDAPRLLRRWLPGSLLATASSAWPLAASFSKQ